MPNKISICSYENILKLQDQVLRYYLTNSNIHQLWSIALKKVYGNIKLSKNVRKRVLSNVIFYSIHHKRDIIVDKLNEFIKLGVKVYNKNILYYACKNGYFDTIKLLIKQNQIDINQRIYNKRCDSALDISIYKCRLDIAKYLIKNGATFNLKENLPQDKEWISYIYKFDVLEFIFLNNFHKNKEVQQYLYDNYHHCCRMGYLNIVRLILENLNHNIIRSYDPEAISMEDAMDRNKKDIIEYLIIEDVYNDIKSCTFEFYNILEYICKHNLSETSFIKILMKDEIIKYIKDEETDNLITILLGDKEYIKLSKMKKYLNNFEKIKILLGLGVKFTKLELVEKRYETTPLDISLPIELKMAYGLFTLTDFCILELMNKYDPYIWENIPDPIKERIWDIRDKKEEERAFMLNLYYN